MRLLISVSRRLPTSASWAVSVKRVEEFLQFGDGQVYQIRNGPSAHFHISGFGTQARAVALGTDRFAPVACQHDAVLYLVLVFLQHLEEVVDADFLFGR